MKLYTNKGGSGDRTFLLLHGLGCNGDVWKGLISKINQAKAGKWIAPDLRGHGRSDWAEEYCVGYLNLMNNKKYEDLMLRFAKEIHDVGVTEDMKKIIAY